MTKIRYKNTGVVVTLAEYKALYPNVAFPEVFIPPETDPILASPRPQVSTSQYLVELPPVQDQLGNWVQAWDILEYPVVEYQARVEAAKVAKRLEINAWRLQTNKTTFVHSNKTIACDELSRGDIDAVANNISLFGEFPTPWAGAWKAVDNTYLMLPTVQDFKNMYASMTSQGSTNFSHSQDLKAAVAAATTLEEIENIQW